MRLLRRLTLSLVGGLLLWSGHAPLDWGLAGAVALVPLLLLAEDVARDRNPLRAGFGWGCLAGLVFFGLLIRWLVPFGYVPWGLLTVIQATSVGAYVAGVALWGRRRCRAVVAVVWWVALEVIRSTVPLGGFGWGTLGATQHDGGMLLPMARLLGVYGVSALCAAIAVTLARMVGAVAEIRDRRQGSRTPPVRNPSHPASTASRPPEVPRIAHIPGAQSAPPGPSQASGTPAVGAGTRRLLPAAGALAAVLAVAGLAGLVSPPAPSGASIDIAGVQAEGLQASGAAGINRISTERIVRVAEQMVDATRPLADDPPELTVWPENSLDADVTDPDNELVRAQLAAGLELVDGGPMLVGGLLDGPRPGTLFNTLMVVDEDGIRLGYRKRQPVPFGEYVPARRYLDWFPPLEQLPTDILASPDGPQVIEVAGASVGGVICFENAFPYLVRSQVRAGADVLVVATNNASFGRSAMPSQHLAQSQLRAVETGRHLLHAGVSGVSALIDPSGDVRQRTEIFEAAIVRDELPLVEGDTVATRLGQLPALTVLVLSALGVAWLLLAELRRARG